MRRILVIVPCGQGKVWDKNPSVGAVQASSAYTGAPFKVNREYAGHFSDKWVILSAKYGFILPDFQIPEGYNVTFKKKSTKPVGLEELIGQVKSLELGNFDLVIGLGGKEYRNMIIQAFQGYNSKVEFPFAGLPLGKAMQAVKNAIQANKLGL